MSAAEPGAPPRPADLRPHGTKPLALVLIAIGIAVAVEWAGFFEVPWQFVLPVALLVIGVAHLAGAKRERHGGLTVLGMAILIVLATSDVVDIPFADRLTDRDSVAHQGAPAPAHAASVQGVLP